MWSLLKKLKGAVALKNLRTIYCFTSLKLTQYIVGFILNATAPLLFIKRYIDIYEKINRNCFCVLILNKKEILIHSYIYLIRSNGGDFE